MAWRMKDESIIDQAIIRDEQVQIRWNCKICFHWLCPTKAFDFFDMSYCSIWQLNGFFLEKLNYPVHKTGR